MYNSSSVEILIMQPVDQYEQQIGSQTHRKYVNGRVDIPAKPFGKLLEHNDG